MIGFAVVLLLAGCSHTPSTVAALVPPHAGTAESCSPGLTLDPATGDVLVCWVAGEFGAWRVWFARSHDRGATWSEPVPVSPDGEAVSVEPESSPIVVCDGSRHTGIAWSTAVADSAGATPAGDIRFARSLDGGRSWGSPVTINDDAAGPSGHHALQSLELLPSGGLYAAWLDARPGGERLDADESEGVDAAIFAAHSDDFGASWSPNAPEWSRVCAASRVGLAVNAQGRPIAAFRKHYPGQVRDVVVGTFDRPAVRASVDDWSIPESPGSGPVIEFSRDATLRLAWFSGAPRRMGVWFRETLPELLDSTAAPLALMLGESLPVVHLGLAEAGMSGTLVACDADTTGDRMLTLVRVAPSGRQVDERIVVPDTRGASYPRVTASAYRRDAYVAWTAQDGGRCQMRLLRWNTGR